jgi:hypothetical protein
MRTSITSYILGITFIVLIGLAIEGVATLGVAFSALTNVWAWLLQSLYVIMLICIGIKFAEAGR